jgi:sulfatase maturation enzyme AslB (radical SAM superfamily)
MTDFWIKEKLFQIHCELSSYCNAACPLCPRYYEGTEILRPDIELNQITLEQFKDWFSDDIVKKTNHWIFCGTVGDPMMAKDAINIIEHILTVNPTVNITVNTNGGMRGEKDWTRLGYLSANSFNRRFKVIFSIDGLEDTNHLYRRNVNWNTLMKNAKAFINAGGKAEWDFLIFRHNEHQIQEAKNLSIELGFATFAPKKALGFNNEGKLVKVAALGKQGEFKYWLEPPTELDNRNFDIAKDPIPRFDHIEPSVIKFYKYAVLDPHNELVDKFDGKSFKEREIDYTDTDCKNISCKSETWGGGREIYVSSAGRVSPCCYVGTNIETTHSTPEIVQLKKKLQDYGNQHFNLNNYSLEEILEAGHLNRVFADSWNQTGANKLMFCANTCGENSQIDKIWSHKDNPRPNKDNWDQFIDN